MQKPRLRRLDWVYTSSPLYFVTACTHVRAGWLACEEIHQCFADFRLTGFFQMTDASKRRAFLRRIVENESVEDIYSEDRGCQWIAFSSMDQKKIKESKVFLEFMIASGLASDPFDHENEDPPLPDIRTTIDGHTYYFELGEITDEGLAIGVSISEKKDEIAGGAFSQVVPLLKMFREKCARPYPTNGAPIDLLLYYSKQYPHEKCLLEYLESNKTEIANLTRQGPFSRIWIYTDWPPRKVLWQAAR